MNGWSNSIVLNAKYIDERFFFWHTFASECSILCRMLYHKFNIQNCACILFYYCVRCAASDNTISWWVFVDKFKSCYENDFRDNWPKIVLNEIEILKKKFNSNLQQLLVSIMFRNSIPNMKKNLPVWCKVYQTPIISDSIRVSNSLSLFCSVYFTKEFSLQFFCRVKIFNHIKYNSIDTKYFQNDVLQFSVFFTNIKKPNHEWVFINLLFSQFPKINFYLSIFLR